jgi:hypothetical protein
MWEIIQHITTPLTLIAFIAALIAIILQRRLTVKKELIETARPEDRAKLIDLSFETYHISPERDNLTREQRFSLVKQVLDQKIKKQKLNSITAISFTIILATTALIGFFISSKNSSNQVVQPNPPVESKFKFAYVPGSDSLGIAYDLEKQFNNLDNTLDEMLAKKTYNGLLRQKFEELIVKSQNELSRLYSFSNNIPINRLIYIQGTLIGGSYLRLALLQEIKGNDSINIIRYSKKAVEAIDTTLKLISLITEHSTLLSNVSNQKANLWLTEESHFDRYHFIKFFSEGLLYRYGGKSSFTLSDRQVSEDFSKIDKDFISKYLLDDTITYPTMGWLMNKKVISL